MLVAVRGSATVRRGAPFGAHIDYEAAHRLTVPLSRVRARARDEGVERPHRKRAERRCADPVREADVLIDKEGTDKHTQSRLPEEGHPPPKALEVPLVVDGPCCAVQQEKFAEVALVEDDREPANGLPVGRLCDCAWLHGAHPKFVVAAGPVDPQIQNRRACGLMT
jgi:hypothetical protein